MRSAGCASSPPTLLGKNRDASALLHLVHTREPDLLVTLESDGGWQGQFDTLLTDMPHRLKCPLDNRYGMHVYSRLPLEAAEIAYSVEPDKPSMHMRMRLRSGHAIRIHCLPRRRARAKTSRRASAMPNSSWSRAAWWIRTRRSS